MHSEESGHLSNRGQHPTEDTKPPTTMNQSLDQSTSGLCAAYDDATRGRTLHRSQREGPFSQGAAPTENEPELPRARLDRWGAPALCGNHRVSVSTATERF